MTFSERVYDPDHIKIIHVEDVGDGLLTLTVDDGQQWDAASISIKLDDDQVRKLRLILQRYEKEHR